MYVQIRRKRPNSTTPDQGVAKKPRNVPTKEDKAEVLQHLHMKKEVNQSMSEFNDELKLQAKKCGIQNSDIIVRDHQIHAITEVIKFLEEVMRLDKPTAEEVFQKYSQIVKVSQGFALEI